MWSRRAQSGRRGQNASCSVIARRPLGRRTFRAAREHPKLHRSSRHRAMQLTQWRALQLHTQQLPSMRGAGVHGTTTWGTIPAGARLTLTTRSSLRLAGRFPAHGGDHFGSGPKTEMCLNLQTAQRLNDDLPAVRALGQRPRAWLGRDELSCRGQRLGAHLAGGAFPVHFDFNAEFVVEHFERHPGLCAKGGQNIPLSALVVVTPFGAQVVTRDNGARPRRIVGHRRGEQISDARGVQCCFHIRAHICSRLPRLSDPQITPISRPFRGDSANSADVPGPLAGDFSRGPDTRAHRSMGTPPVSAGKGERIRSVVGWVESGHEKRGHNDTRGLSSCLLNSTRWHNPDFGGRGGR